MDDQIIYLKSLKLFFETGETWDKRNDYAKAPHLGEFIESVYMGPFGLTCRALARHIGVAATTLNRVCKRLKWDNARNGIAIV